MLWKKSDFLENFISFLIFLWSVRQNSFKEEGKLKAKGQKETDIESDYRSLLIVFT